MVASVNKKHEVFSKKRLDGDFQVVDGEVHDDGVELLGKQAGEQIGGVALVYRHVYAGVLLFELREQLGKEPASGGTNNPEASVAADLIAPAGHLRRDVVEFVHHPARLLHHEQALIGETAALAVDKDHAEFALEPCNVPADVGLHGVQRPGGGRERAVIGDGNQCGELAKVHH